MKLNINDSDGPSDTHQEGERMAKHNRTELTPNERSFVVELLRVDDGKPSGPGEAYERAFGPVKSRSVASSLASRVLGRDCVRNYLDKEKRLRELEARRNARNARGWIERSLRDIAETADRPSDRVSALRELRQLIPEGDADDLDTLSRAAVVERIRTLLASQLGVIETHPVSPVGGGVIPAGEHPGGFPGGIDDAVDVVSTTIEVDSVSTEGVVHEDAIPPVF